MVWVEARHYLLSSGTSVSLVQGTNALPTKLEDDGVSLWWAATWVGDFGEGR